MATEIGGKLLCWALSNKGRCRESLPDELGYRWSGFCEKCWFPGIDTSHSLYRSLKAEGHSHMNAAVTAGLMDPPNF